jgi:hypothetical protein
MSAWWTNAFEIPPRIAINRLRRRPTRRDVWDYLQSHSYASVFQEWRATGLPLPGTGTRAAGGLIDIVVVG